MRTILSRAAAALAFAAIALAPFAANADAVSPSPGDLIKSDGSTSVYYYGADFKRYVFPNDKTYHTWYADFAAVKTVTAEQLAFMPIGGNVTYRPAARLVKVTTDPKVYVVSKRGILRPLASESVARTLYGADWSTKVDDLPDAFFADYRVGAAVGLAADCNLGALIGGVPSIDVDKSLVLPPNGYVDVRANVGYSPDAVTVTKGTAVTWIALDDSMPSVTATPSGTQTTLPGFGTTTIPMGQSWSFTFSDVGVWGYKNGNYVGQDGTVTVR